MKKAYLFVHDNGCGSREAVKKILDEMPQVLTWRYDMPNAFYIISEDTAEVLAEEFHKHVQASARFVFVEFSGNEQGWLTDESWYLINTKTHKPE